MEVALEQLSRVTEFVHTPDEEPLKKELMTLLAQRRELVTAATQHIWEGKLEAFPRLVSEPPPTFNMTEEERQAAQAKILCFPYLHRQPGVREALEGEMTAAGSFLKGVPEVEALTRFFTSRAEALRCERRMISQQLAAKKHQELTALSQAKGPDPHVPLLEAKSEEEESLIGRYMAVLLHGEADAAGRAARLQQQQNIMDADWRAVALHVASRGAPGRVALRFASRMRWLPYSHHHRFPLYEKLTLAAEERNARAEVAGIIYPPETVHTYDDLQRQYLDISAYLNLTGSDGVVSLEKFDAEFNPEDADGHRAAYVARTALPEVLVRQACLRPRRRHVPSVHAQALASAEGVTPGVGSTDGVTSSDEEEQMVAQLPSIRGLIQSLPKVYLVDNAEDVALEQVTASLAGSELNAGDGASLRGEVHHVDEILRAESDYLDQWDVAEVAERMRSLAESHQEQSRETGSAADEDDEGGAEGAGSELPLKKLEAMYAMRHMKSAQHKLQVLHHINALVALRRRLLRDEEEEEAMAASSASLVAEMAVPAADGRVGGAFREARQAGGPGEAAAHQEPIANESGAGKGPTADSIEAHPQVGVCVRNWKGEMIVYAQAVKEFEETENQILRMATYFLEKRAQVLAADGESRSINDLDRMQVVMQMWEFEASFASARQKAIDAYMNAYRNAVDWGLEDMWGEWSPWDGGTPECMRYGGAGKGVRHSGAGSGEGQKQAKDKIPGLQAAEGSSLGSRRCLRQEVVDLSFRRPGVSLADTYFAARYMQEEVALEAEAALVAALTALTAEAESALLLNSHTSTAAANGMESDGSLADVWELGLQPALVLAPTLKVGRGGGELLRQLPVLPSVGTAAALLPSLVATSVEQLAEAHQIQGAVARRELRFLVLQAALAEVGTLRQEETTRRQHPVPPPPRDSKFATSSMSKTAEPSPQFSWLVPSVAVDSPVIYASAMREAGIGGLPAIRVALQREQLVRTLYETEVQHLVHYVQCAALGRKLVEADQKGIEWEAIGPDGVSLRHESLEDMELKKDPSDVSALGTSREHTHQEAPQDSRADFARVRSYMFGLGRSGVMGVVNRAPPLAAFEFSTSLADGLEMHSLKGLRRAFDNAAAAGEKSLLHSAVRAQTLKMLTTKQCIEHNQIILDAVTIRLERERQALALKATRLIGKSLSTVPNMHAGVDRSAVPGLRVPSGKTPGSERALKRRVPDEMTEKTISRLNWLRHHLVEQVSDMILSVFPLRLDLLKDIRKEFVDRGRLTASGHMTHEEQVEVKRELFELYASRQLSYILPFSLRTHAARLTERLARGLLGSAGGVGSTWGLSSLAAYDEELNPHPARVGPYFHGPAGLRALQAALLEYGPMWQQAVEAPSETDADIDFSSVIREGNPGGVAFAVSAAGSLDAAQLWRLPGQLDILAFANSPLPLDHESNAQMMAQLPDLDTGVLLLSELVSMVDSAIAAAGLVVKGSHLAAGGDVDPEAHDRRGGVDGDRRRGIDEILASVGRRGPNVPGALMTQAFNRLQANIDALGAGGAVSSGKKTTKSQVQRPTTGIVPAQAVIGMLATQRQVELLVRLASVDRLRLRLLGSGPVKAGSWYALGRVEAGLGASLNAAQLPGRGLLLHLPDAERAALHNELLRFELLMERSVEDGGINPLRQPTEALAGRLYTAGLLWLHDRYRDAFVWHAIRAEDGGKAQQQPAPLDAPFPKGFRLSGLKGSEQLFDSRAMAALERGQAMYEDIVLAAARKQLSVYPIIKRDETPALLPGTSPLTKSANVGSSRIKEDTVPEDAWWNVGTVSDKSAEAREMEACILAMKRHIDRSTVQLRIDALHRDCALLVGLAFRAEPGAEEQHSSKAQQGRPYSPLAPRSRSSSAAGATAGTTAGDAAANAATAGAAVYRRGSAYGSSGKGARQVLETPSGAFQFAGDYGMAQVQRLVRRLKGLQRASRGAATGSSTFVTEEEGEEAGPGAIVVQEGQLHKWLEDVFRAMYTEGGQLVSVAANSVASEISSLEQLSRELAMRLSELEVRKGDEDKKHHLSLETQVCNRGMDLLKLLSDMRRQALDMQDQAEKAVGLAAAEAKGKWEGQVERLERELMVAKANFEVVRNDLKQGAMVAMAQVKQDAMRRLLNMRGGDQPGRANTERIMDLETEVQQLKKALNDNEQAVLKVRIMYKLKMMAFNQRCQRQVDEALADMTAMEKRKWEVQEETRMERDLLQQQLQATQEDLAQVQAELGSVSKDLGRTVNYKNRLMKWKMDRKSEFQRMKQQCVVLKAQKDRAMERLAGLKDARLQLKSEVEGLSDERSVAAVTKNAAEIEYISRPLNKKVSELQKMLSEERSVKEDMQKRMAELEAQLRSAQAAIAGVKDENPKWSGGLQGDMVYKQRYEQLQIKMQEMAGETSDLRYVVAGLFNAVPEVFASLDPGRLKGIGFVPHRKRSEMGATEDVEWKPKTNPLRPQRRSSSQSHRERRAGAGSDAHQSSRPGTAASSPPPPLQSNAGSSGSVGGGGSRAGARPGGLADPGTEYPLEYRPSVQSAFQSAPASADSSALALRAEEKAMSRKESPPRRKSPKLARNRTPHAPSSHKQFKQVADRPRDRLFTTSGRPISAAQRNRSPPIPKLALEPRPSTASATDRPYSGLQSSRARRALSSPQPTSERAAAAGVRSPGGANDGETSSLVRTTSALQKQYLLDLQAGLSRSPSPSPDNFGPWVHDRKFAG